MKARTTIGRTAGTVAALLALAVIAAPAAQADPWQLEQAAKASSISDASDRGTVAQVLTDAVDRHLANRSGGERQLASHRDLSQEYGIPRAMPSDYAAAGVVLDGRYGMPRAMPSDYATRGVDVGSKYVPFQTDFPALTADRSPSGISDHADRIRGENPFTVVAQVDRDTDSEWQPFVIGLMIGLGLALLAALTLLSLRRRRTLAHA